MNEDWKVLFGTLRTGNNEALFEEKKKAVRKAQKILQENELDYVLLTTSEEANFLSDGVAASLEDILRMLDSFFEDMSISDMALIKHTVFKAIERKQNMEEF